jgi:nucleoside-diphosphate-sugar epimerase
MSVAVTGATGFIGRHVVAHLVGSGVDVRAIVRPGTVCRPALGTTVVTSTLETPSLVQAFRGADTIVHLAGVVNAVSQREYAEVNVEGTRAVVNAAQAVNARLIHISSLSVAGPASAAAPSTEDTPPDPMTPYGRSKLASEHVVRSATGLHWTILRPTIVYGPGDRSLLPLFRWAKRGILPIIGRRDAAYTFVHVSDVSRAIGAAIDGSADGQVFFVGHPRIVTPADLDEHIRSAVGRRRAITVPLPHAIVWLAALVAEGIGRTRGRPMPLNLARVRELWASGFVCRVDRIREQLNVAAEVDLPEGLADTAAWYEREGWL